MLDQPVARWIIQQLLNGNAFYVAMALLTFAGMSRWLVGEPGRWTRLGRGLACGVGAVLLGLTLSSIGFFWVLYLFALLVFAIRRRWFEPRRGHFIGFAALVAVAIYVGEFEDATIPKSQPAPIVVYGDSLSAAYGVAADRTWPALLGRMTGRPVDNRAVAGSRVADALARQRAEPAAGATVLVLIGGNDQLGGTSALVYVADLHELIDDLLERGNVVIQFEVPVTPTAPQFGWLQKTATVGDRYAFVHRRVVADAIFAEPGTTADGLHLSAAGHESLAKRIVRFMDLP